MTSRRARLAALVFALAAVGSLGAWWLTRDRAAPPASTSARGSSRALARLAAYIAPVPSEAGHVGVAGTVREASTGRPVANIELVLRGASREATARSGSDGTFRLAVPRGTYRVFVRDREYLTVAPAQRSLLNGDPDPSIAGLPDEALLPVLDVRGPLAAVEVPVVRGTRITGTVVDRDARPIAGAIVRALGPVRPVLATDLAVSDADGHYTLHLPAGVRYVVDASHERYAGPTASLTFGMPPGTPGAPSFDLSHDLTLTAGCIITGKVVGADGRPGPDGALERWDPARDPGFGPSGSIAPGGAFRWTTTEQARVTLRAWPWRSPHSESRNFACSDGARFDDVVFALPAMRPDLAGTLVDASGKPVPFAFLDLTPLQPGGIGQQERSDAEGNWHFYRVPSGPYRVRAQAPGRGVIAATVMAPSTDVPLALRGSGTVRGTTTHLADGAFELVELACRDFANGALEVNEPPRLVVVTGGQFEISGLPACKLEARAVRGRQTATLAAEVPTHGLATVELELGVPRSRRIHGIVRNTEGTPVARVLVLTRTKDGNGDQTQTDANGRYELVARPGAVVKAVQGSHVAERSVGTANVPDERIDLVIQPGASK